MLTTILQALIGILSFIVGLLQPHTGVRQAVYITDFECSPAKWSNAPKMTFGEFHGTVETRCEFEGKGGEGIQGLKAHLEKQLPLDSTVHSQTKEFYEGLPSTAFHVTIEMSDSSKANGITHLATNGKNLLRDVFETSNVSGSGDASLVRQMKATMEVRPLDGKSLYELRASQAIRVRKPRFTSSSQFRANLKQQAEEAILDRAGGAVQEMARHL